ncbi:hypothetical protein [Xenorhabdus stockiae]|uniref:hypothetical protein n=1 Tax=Xenorhabdus stockiae TaxID=351614 RepID=UPI004063124B
MTTIHDAETSLGKPTSSSSVQNGGVLLQWIYSQGSLVGSSGGHAAVLFDKNGKMVQIVHRTQI